MRFPYYGKILRNKPLLLGNFACFSADVNECRGDEHKDCHMYANCINTDGNYTCECQDGFTGDGWKHCQEVENSYAGYHSNFTISSFQCRNCHACHSPGFLTNIVMGSQQTIMYVGRTHPGLPMI